MLNEPLEFARLLNLIVAALALFLNLFKAYKLRVFRHLEMDVAIGFLAVLAWCLGYFVATLVGWFSGVDVGIWTVIMSIPIAWTFASGFFGWPTEEVRTMRTSR